MILPKTWGCEMEREVRIEDWSFIFSDLNPYQAPENQVCRLYGRVFGHPNGSDGDVVSTSAIQAVDISAKKVRTINRIYTLGDPDPEFLDYLKENGYTLEQYNKGTI